MVKIYTDAAFNPKTKQAAIVMHYYQQQQLFQATKTLTDVTDNHEAEFKAMILGIENALENQLSNSLCQFFSDSKIVIQSIEKRYVKEQRYRPFLDSILTLINHFDLVFFQWIPEKENLAADQLAKSVLHKMKNN